MHRIIPDAFQKRLRNERRKSLSAAQNIIEVGKRLIQAKLLVNHGHWQNWLEKNFQLKERSARNFMECAERYGNRQTFANLGYSQMIALLSLPDAEETEKFIAEKAAENLRGGEMLINVDIRGTLPLFSFTDLR